MAVTKEYIKSEINWFNSELRKLKENLEEWLIELGHQISVDEKEITNIEDLSGNYTTTDYTFLIDNELRVILHPFGIWLIGAKGRIDLIGPSGKEKLIYLLAEGPGIKSETKNSSGNVIKKRHHRYFDNVDTDGWYWYDDSSYRKVEKFREEMVSPLLERLQ